MAMTMDGELVELSAGKSISLLERTMLRKLEGSLGKEVIIHCDGKGKTKRGQDLWYYRAWEVGQVAASPRIGAA